MPDIYGREWPGLPVIEMCYGCGQPDNTGDCSCDPLSTEEVILLGGVLGPQDS